MMHAVPIPQLQLVFHAFYYHERYSWGGNLMNMSSV